MGDLGSSRLYLFRRTAPKVRGQAEVREQPAVAEDARSGYRAALQDLEKEVFGTICRYAIERARRSQAGCCRPCSVPIRYPPDGL